LTEPLISVSCENQNKNMNYTSQDVSSFNPYSSTIACLRGEACEAGSVRKWNDQPFAGKFVQNFNRYSFLFRSSNEYCTLKSE